MDDPLPGVLVSAHRTVKHRQGNTLFGRFHELTVELVLGGQEPGLLGGEVSTRDGTIDPAHYSILATADPFDHCVFTVCRDFDPDTEARWLKVLYSMSYGNPLHRQMMDMEGLKQWEPGRTSGFAALTGAADKLHYFA